MANLNKVSLIHRRAPAAGHLGTGRPEALAIEDCGREYPTFRHQGTRNDNASTCPASRPSPGRRHHLRLPYRRDGRISKREEDRKAQWQTPAWVGFRFRQDRQLATAGLTVVATVGLFLAYPLRYAKVRSHSSFSVQAARCGSVRAYPPRALRCVYAAHCSRWALGGDSCAAQRAVFPRCGKAAQSPGPAEAGRFPLVNT